MPKFHMQDISGNDQDILLWWRDNSPKFPHLAKMTRQFLAAPTSCAFSDRVFSSARKMHDDLEKNTSEGTMESQVIVCLN